MEPIRSEGMVRVAARWIATAVALVVPLVVAGFVSLLILSDCSDWPFGSANNCTFFWNYAAVTGVYLLALLIAAVLIGLLWKSRILGGSPSDPRQTDSPVERFLGDQTPNGRETDS